ncbi:MULTISPECIES: LPS export ABC transporter permease LptG [unclassified Rhodosalinus]|uniref:LPS export ABC transporter permease LptG n=1 Tax=unclassified Rhodosalinus TaxID=2630183 RepID=UPI00352398DE
MILHLYFARRFAQLFGGLLLVFFLFLGLIDMVEQLRRFEEAGFGEIMKITLLNMPQVLYQFLPLVMILSAIGLFLGLSRSSELVVTRAAGRSGLTALLGPLVVAALIGAATLTLGNPLVAATSERYAELRERYGGGGSVISIGREGLWLRQGGASGQTVIRADRANADATVLYDVSFVSYAPGGGPVRRIEAARAELGDGAWELSQAKDWPLATGTNPEAAATVHDRLTLPSTLTREGIRDSFGQPASVSIWHLPAFISTLEEAGFSARRHAVWFQMELSRPLFLISMMMVGAAFTMRHARAGRTGLFVLAAVMLGFGLYYIRNFAQILGESGQLAPWLAAWTPPLASVLLAMGVLLNMEEG